MAESIEHKKLKQVAMRWLQKTGCVAWAFEVSFSHIGIVDVMGLKKDGNIYIVEAKRSNSDLKNDFKEYGRRYRLKYSRPSKIDNFRITKQIDFLYYICADCVDTSALPAFIGILSESGNIKRRATRLRPNIKSDKDKYAAFMKIAKALSWRKYKHVIYGGKEQLEFDIS